MRGQTHVKLKLMNEFLVYFIPVKSSPYEHPSHPISVYFIPVKSSPYEHPSHPISHQLTLYIFSPQIHNWLAQPSVDEGTRCVRENEEVVCESERGFFFNVRLPPRPPPMESIASHRTQRFCEHNLGNAALDDGWRA